MKSLRIVLAFVVFVSAMAGSISAQTTADAVIDEARKYIGTPYRAAGRTPKGFDCSGFTRYVYGKFGYDLSGSAPGQWHHGHNVQRSELQRGDLVFFGGRRKSRSIGHVGIVTDVNAEKGTFNFIHSSSKGVRISVSTEGYYVHRYIGARRLLDTEPRSARQIQVKDTKSEENVNTRTQQQPSRISKPLPPSDVVTRQQNQDVVRDNAIRDSIKAIL